MSSSQGQAQRQGGVLAQERRPPRPQLRVQLHHQQLGQPVDPAGQTLRHGKLQLRGGQRGSTEDVPGRLGDCVQ